jgi:HEAT repeat protein
VSRTPTTPTPLTTADLESKIDRLRRAEEEVRRLQDELIDDAAADRAKTIAALKEAVAEGLGEGDGVEAAIALVPIVEVLAELDGPDVCDLLVDAMGSDDPETRHTAGKALEDLAFERYKEVAQAIERAVERLPATHHALRELPFTLAEVGEPGMPRALRGYLAHKEGDVVAGAIEALAMAGDPAAIGELRKLVKDPRTVVLTDEGEGAEQVSIGMLASEAVALLSEGEPPRGAPPQRPQGERRQGPPPQRPQGDRNAHARPNKRR